MKYCYQQAQKMSIKIVLLLILILSFNQAFTQGAGNALNFDGWTGGGEYVDFGTASQLRITGDLTIEAWVYLASPPASGQYSL